MTKQFTKKDIENMRSLRQEGQSTYKIAATFGVPATAIQNFVADIKPEKSLRVGRTHLSNEDRQRITNMYAQGFAVDQIARFMDITEVTVMNNINKNKTAI